jgi:hypothetical protein
MTLGVQPMKASDLQRDRLNEILAQNGGPPITLRDLERRHRLDREVNHIK